MSENTSDATSDEEFNVELDGHTTTVDALNSDISGVISQERSNKLDFDYVIGDVSDDSESNGTRYFQLVNNDAGIQCLVFQHTRDSIPEFDEGDRVAVKGKLTFYEARSNCSVYVDSVVPVGESKRHAEIQQIKEDLRSEGLFDEENKQSVPSYPTGIGVVTSKGSDAEEDAVTSIHDQHPNVDIYLYNASVQGMSALEELCEGIAYLDSHSNVDTVIVTRGGGSEQDLHVFNSEGVSRMIADSDTPVVTAIGHENDTPIADQVADDRAMTPTEIGPVVVEDRQRTLSNIDSLHDKLLKSYENTTHGRLNDLDAELKTVFDDFASTRVQSLSNSLEATYDGYCDSQITALENELESAHTLFVKEKEHEEETADLKYKTTLYKIAIVALLVLFVITIFILL